jgi:hypothetical protein
MDVFSVMDLAAIRHAELIEEAAQQRLMRSAVAHHRGRRRWRLAVRDAVMAFRVAIATTRRADRTKPSPLAPATETA